LITPPFSVEVVTNHATIPATKPATDPAMQPHLFALLQVMQRAMGTTPDPRMTPINVCHSGRGVRRNIMILISIKPT
jgi:hypothetical protein